MPYVDERAELIQTKQYLAPRYAQWMRAFWECNDKVQQVVRDMVEILNAPDADEDDKEMAVATLLEALFPSHHNGALGADLQELESSNSDVVSELDAQEATFAGRVAALMDSKGVTQSMLAERIGIQQPAVSMMLSREARLQRRTVVKIADALGVSVDELWPSGRS